MTLSKLFALATSVVLLIACSPDEAGHFHAADSGAAQANAGTPVTMADASPPAVDAAPVDGGRSTPTRTPSVVEVCAGGYDCGGAGQLHLHSDGSRCLLSGISIVDTVLCPDGTVVSSAGGTDGATSGTWQGDAIAFSVHTESATYGAHMGGARTPSEMSLRCIWATEK
jgi:hypothetical protein